MNGRWSKGLAITLMLVFAMTRWPGLMPENFSAAYGLAFCAGVYFSGTMAWWLPLGTLLISDVIMNVVYYETAPVGGYMLVNYAAFAVLVALGRSLGPRASWVSLVSGGIVGAMIFYILTNTFSWLQNPQYVKTLSGWVQALTVGTPGWPPTWQFFRATLFSGGLFTALFAGAMKISEALEENPEAEDAPENAEPAPEESKA